MRYYEDIELGKPQRFGAKLVTREEVIAFAAQFDPQPFHMDDEAAAKTHFGRISASGWHTAAMVMRMIVDHMQSGEGQAGLGSPGLDQLRWLKPVYPGDTLTCESEVIEKRRSQSKPEMGLMKSRLTCFNQHGEAVLSHIGNGMIATRDPGGTD